MDDPMEVLHANSTVNTGRLTNIDGSAVATGNPSSNSDLFDFDERTFLEETHDLDVTHYLPNRIYSSFFTWQPDHLEKPNLAAVQIDL